MPLRENEMAEFVRNLVAGLSDRERRLVAFMGVVFFLLVIFLFVFFVQSGISDLKSANREHAKSLRLISDKEQDYLESQLERQRSEAKGKVNLTPLRTLVDKISKQFSVSVPDIKELPEQRQGGQWLEHSVELSMREIGIADLTKFMVEVEGNRRKFPIAITKLEIRKRKKAEDKYDVKMVVSTYERDKTEAAPTKKRTAGAGRKGGI